jgi:hypothetical protein
MSILGRVEKLEDYVGSGQLFDGTSLDMLMRHGSFSGDVSRAGPVPNGAYRAAVSDWLPDDPG